MKKYFLIIPALVFLFCSNLALAGYDPNIGVWLSRDPMENITGDSPEIVQGPNLYAYVSNNPVNWVDPTGLEGVDSPSASLNSALLRGDAAALKNLATAGEAAGLSPAQAAAARAAAEKFGSKAGDWIAKKCLGKINQEFPSQLRGHTLEQIKQMAQKGDAVAKKAWKLLNDSRFQK